MSSRGGNNENNNNRGGPMDARGRGGVARGALDSGGGRGRGDGGRGRGDSGRGRGGGGPVGQSGNATTTADANLAVQMAEMSVGPAKVNIPEGPPLLWDAKELENLGEHDAAFFEYYKQQGWVEQPILGSQYGGKILPRLESVCHDVNGGVIGKYWQTTPGTAPLGSVDYLAAPDILIHPTFEEAEAERKSTLAELQKEFAMTEERTRKWFKLRARITSYSKPVQFVQLAPRMDNERAPALLDSRMQSGQLQDIRVPRSQDPNVETWDRFAPAIRSMQRAKILPQGEWQPGTTWGEQLKSSRADEEEEQEDGAAAQSDSELKPTSTFHGFRARRTRPAGFGLGHHGYDDVHVMQRDGVRYTSDDVPKGPWMEDPNVPIQFTHEGKAVLTTEPLKEDNPVFDECSAGERKPLHYMLKEAESLTQAKAAQKKRLEQDKASSGASAPGLYATSPPPKGKAPVYDSPGW